jgi:hypothetical protein
MNFQISIQAFFSSAAGLAVQGVAILAALDFITGTLRAVANGTFQWDAIASWLRKHGAGRVGTIFAFLFLGYLADPVFPKIENPVGDGSLSVNVIMGLGLAGAAMYTAETIASLKENFLPTRIALPEADEEGNVTGGVTVEEIDPVPTD